MFLFSYFAKNFLETPESFELDSFYIDNITAAAYAAQAPQRFVGAAWERNYSCIFKNIQKSQKKIRLHPDSGQLTLPMFSETQNLLFTLLRYYYDSHRRDTKFRYFFYIYLNRTLCFCRYTPIARWATRSSGVTHFIAILPPTNSPSWVPQSLEHVVKYHFPVKRTPRKFLYWLFSRHAQMVFPGICDANFHKYFWFYGHSSLIELFFFFTIIPDDDLQPQHYYSTRQLTAYLKISL